VTAYRSKELTRRQSTLSEAIKRDIAHLDAKVQKVIDKVEDVHDEQRRKSDATAVKLGTKFSLDLNDAKETKEKQNILEWISPLNFWITHEDIFRRRHGSTGRWLIDSQTFQEWHDATGKILWCPGIRRYLCLIVVRILLTAMYSGCRQDDPDVRLPHATALSVTNLLCR